MAGVEFEPATFADLTPGPYKPFNDFRCWKGDVFFINFMWNARIELYEKTIVLLCSL